MCDVATQQVSACLSHALTSTPSRAQSNIAGSEPSPSGSIPATTSCDQSGPTPSKPLVDHLLMVFVLSAVHPQDCIAFLRNACEVLREGGRLLLRDYGLYDMTMLRFPKSQVCASLHVAVLMRMVCVGYCVAAEQSCLLFS